MAFFRNVSPANVGVRQYIVLAISLNGEESLKKILLSRFRSSPKLNRFVLVTHPTYPPTFVQICPFVFEIFCKISFLSLSLNGEESLKNARNRIQILTNNVWCCSWPVTYIYRKFHNDCFKTVHKHRVTNTDRRDRPIYLAK